MITFDRAQSEVGSVVSGTVALPAAPAKPLTAWMVWRLVAIDLSRVAIDGGRAIGDYALVEKRRLEAGPAGSRFEFKLPAQGPVTYDGKLFRVFWEIVAGTESPSEGIDVLAHEEFRVVSTGQIPQRQTG